MALAARKLSGETLALFEAASAAQSVIHSARHVFTAAPTHPLFLEYLTSFEPHNADRNAAAMLEAYPKLREQYCALVPQEVSSWDFWLRYYFRLALLCDAEQLEPNLAVALAAGLLAEDQARMALDTPLEWERIEKKRAQHQLARQWGLDQLKCRGESTARTTELFMAKKPRSRSNSSNPERIARGSEEVADDSGYESSPPSSSGLSLAIASPGVNDPRQHQTSQLQLEPTIRQTILTRTNVCHEEHDLTVRS